MAKSEKRTALLEHLRILCPVFVRLSLIVVFGLVVASFFGFIWGLTSIVVGFFVEMMMHLHYVVRLADWLNRPDFDRIPNTLFGLWDDIFKQVYTSRKALDKNTKRLEEREARYRTTLTALPEGVVLVKSDFVLSWCNPNATQILGLNLEKDVGSSLLVLITDSALKEYLRTGAFEEEFHWKPEKSDRTYEVSVVLVNRKNAFIVLRDISEQERVDATRRDFVANVSHELRTPLTVLSGFLDLAAQDPQPTVVLQKQHVQLMQGQADRMRRIVDDLLELSRLEIDSDDKVCEIVCLRELIESVSKEIRLLAGADYAIECSGESACILGYPDEVRSAVTNLMTNAVRYSPDGGRIQVHCRTNSDGVTELSVRDSGIGIEPQDVGRLTERFYRVDKSRSRDTGGTGLGLAIVKHVVLRHGAELRIVSAPGKGSCFTILFPAFRQVS